MVNVGWSELLTAVLAMAFLITALRWTFSADRGRRPRKVHYDSRYGLLEQAALVPDEDTGVEIRDELARAGMRATLAARDDGDVEILVFARDLATARATVRAYAARSH